MATAAQASAEEFEDVLHSGAFDGETLQLLSRNGIPEKVRAETWSRLLGMSVEEPALDLPLIHSDSSYYFKRVRGEVSRYCRQHRLTTNRTIQERMESIISMYLSNHQEKDFTPSLVYLCGPFVSIYVSEHHQTAYLAYSKMLDLIDDWLSTHSLEQQLSNFVVLLRQFIPDLYNHFEEEEVDIVQHITPWFETVLSKNLPYESVARLWDFYFSNTNTTNGLSMHVYTCLAILAHYKEELEELEQSEIQAFLFRLPDSFHIEQIMVQANQFSALVLQSNLGTI